MSPDQVLAAANGSARKSTDEDRKGYYGSDNIKLVGNYKTMGFDFFVQFWFCELKLCKVMLRQSDTIQERDVIYALRQSYGDPVRTDMVLFTRLFWNDKAKGNSIELLSDTSSGKFLVITYTPLSDKKDGGL
ncbi:MAG: hypothetical protein F8N39_17070 [Clostridiaceae bacterium]|nr:hypothetical protein [Clostridiaceae bacterium]